MELAQLTIHEILPKIKKREVSVVEVTQSVLNRIEKIDPIIKSFIHVCGDDALTRAKSIDVRLSKGEDVGPLCGIPIAPKDIYLTKGIPTTCASKILKGYIPPYSSKVIDDCLASGAVIVGKVNLDEFAMGSSTENSSVQITRNPWDVNRVPGGSSGGSAAAVASDCCLASLGTDTGGSIRQPASLCGIVGLKPTYGRLSRYGVIAFASSLDQMGPMTKDVTDCALLMNVIAGPDPRDSTSLNAPVPDYTQFLSRSIQGMRIGIPKEYFVEGMQKEVEVSIRKAMGVLEKLGAEILEVSLPHTEYATACYYILAPAEASSNLARYDGVRFGTRAPGDSLQALYENTKTQGFGAEVKRRIMLGTYVLSAGYYEAYYRKAQKARTKIREDFLNAFEKVDVLLTPTSPTTAFKIGEKTEDPLQMYLSDIFTIALNMAGLPGLSLPCGFDDNGLPIGLQLIGPALEEGRLLQVAHAYEQATDWHTRKPIIIA